MPVGPGKFDLLCTYVREKATAEAAAVVIISAKEGAGFSVQCPPELSPLLANTFRHVADEIERQFPNANPAKPKTPEAS